MWSKWWKVVRVWVFGAAGTVWGHVDTCKRESEKCWLKGRAKHVGAAVRVVCDLKVALQVMASEICTECAKSSKFVCKRYAGNRKR